MNNLEKKFSIYVERVISEKTGEHPTNELINGIVDNAVKLFVAPAVCNRRELLIAFIEWYREDDMSKFSPEHLADWFLKSN